MSAMQAIPGLVNTAGRATMNAAVSAAPNAFGQIAGQAMDWGALLGSEGLSNLATGALTGYQALQGQQALDLQMQAMKQNMSQSEIAFGREEEKDRNRMNAFSGGV